MRVVIGDPIVFSSNGDLSQPTVTSQVLSIEHMVYFAIQLVTTGTPTGTLTLEASNDKLVWTTVAGSSVAVSAADDFLYDVRDAGYSYVRVLYTRTGGSGTLTGTFSAKGM